MELPSKIKADPSGNVLTGIVYSLKNTYGISDPIEKGIIVLSSTETANGNISDTIVSWTTSPCWATVNTKPNPFYQVSFPKGSIDVSGYFLRGCGTGFVYPKAWRVYGFNEDNKNNEESWDVLGDNYSASSQPYCYTSYDVCKSFDTGTFTVKKTNRYYKYVRLVQTQSSRNGEYRFVVTGFDIYGTLLLSSARKSRCTCVRKRRIINQDVVHIIIGMALIYS